ncbi:MAG: EbsA family protein [Aureispira sp.]
MAIISLVVSAVAVIWVGVMIELGSYITLILCIYTLSAIIQYRHYSKPYIIIENKVILIRLNWLRKIRINLDDIDKIERKMLRLKLRLHNGSKKSIALFYMNKETQKRLAKDLTDLLEGELDLSVHLME